MKHLRVIARVKTKTQLCRRTAKQFDIRNTCLLPRFLEGIFTKNYFVTFSSSLRLFRVVYAIRVDGDSPQPSVVRLSRHKRNMSADSARSLLCIQVGLGC